MKGCENPENAINPKNAEMRKCETCGNAENAINVKNAKM